MILQKKKRDFCVDKYLIKKDLIKEGVPSQDLIVSGGHMVKLGDEYHLPIYSKLIENIQRNQALIIIIM